MLRNLTPEQVQAEIQSPENRYFTAQNYGVDNPTDEQLVANYYQHNIVAHIIEFHVEEQLDLFPTTLREPTFYDPHKAA